MTLILNYLLKNFLLKEFEIDSSQDEIKKHINKFDLTKNTKK